MLSKKTNCPYDCPLKQYRSLSVGVPLQEALATCASFGDCQLTVKSNGLTSLTKFQIGTLEASGSVFHDQRNQVAISSYIKLTLFRCPFTELLRVALSSTKHASTAYLAFRKVAWSSAEAKDLATLLSCFQDKDRGNCLRDCGQWLDDWSENPKLNHQKNALQDLDTIRTSDEIQIINKNGCIDLTCTLRPSFIDVDETVLRICEREQAQIALVDLERVMVTRLSSRITRITSTPPNAEAS